MHNAVWYGKVKEMPISRCDDGWDGGGQDLRHRHGGVTSWPPVDRGDCDVCLLLHVCMYVCMYLVSYMPTAH